MKSLSLWMIQVDQCRELMRLKDWGSLAKAIFDVHEKIQTLWVYVSGRIITDSLLLSGH